jgi:phage/plasmid-associated DNA primase
MMQYTESLRGQTKSISFKNMALILPEDLSKETYELIPNEGQIRPYFDMDMDPEKAKKKGYNFDEMYKNKQKYLNEHCNIIKEWFKEGSLAISEASETGVKISYHIVISNYETTMNDMWKLAKEPQFKDSIFFDSAVYHSPRAVYGRKFRLPYTTKEGRPMIPIDSKIPINNHFVSMVDESPNKRLVIKETDEPLEIITPKKGIGALLAQTDDRAEWFKIGVSLHVCLGVKSGYDEFLMYSRLHHSYDAIHFNDTWKSIINYGYSRGGWNLLKKYLPMEHWKNYITSQPPLTDFCDKKVAEWFLKDFDEFSIKHSYGNWYIFKKHHWQYTPEENVEKHFYKHVGNRYEQEVNNCTIPETRTKIQKISNRAGSFGFANSAFKQLKRMVYDEEFNELLDQNPYLLAFENGVYDLETKTFRDGKESDCITLSCGYDWTEEENAKKISELEDIIMKICCDERKRYDTLLNILSRNLAGDNSMCNQRFYVFYGATGSNGKSMLCSLLNEAMGKYYTCTNTSLVTQKEARSDSANPDLVGMVGRRIAMMSESELNVPLNQAQIKKMTGDSTIEYRGLYQKTKVKTNITWSFLLLTNDKLKIRSDDRGFMRRFIYVPFQASFVENPEDHRETKDNKIYKGNDNLHAGTIKEYRLEFMQLLIKRFKLGKITFSKEILEETDKLVKDSDALADYLEELFEPSSKSDYGLSWNSIKHILISKDNARYRQSRAKMTENEYIEAVIRRLKYAYWHKVKSPKEFKVEGGRTKR